MDTPNFPPLSQNEKLSNGQTDRWKMANLNAPLLESGHKNYIESHLSNK